MVGRRGEFTHELQVGNVGLVGPADAYVVRHDVGDECQRTVFPEDEIRPLKGRIGRHQSFQQSFIIIVIIFLGNLRRGVHVEEIRCAGDGHRKGQCRQYNPYAFHVHRRFEVRR